MKKFFLVLSLLLSSVSLIAQTVSEHLTFKGVPIDGTLNEYVKKWKTLVFPT